MRDTTGVGERGISAQGALGHLGAPRVSLSDSRSGGPGDQQPWRGVGTAPRSRVLRRHHQHMEASKVAGRERQAKCPEMGRLAV